MKRPISNAIRNIRAIALTVVFIISLNGCAHEMNSIEHTSSIKPVYISSTADMAF